MDDNTPRHPPRNLVLSRLKPEESQLLQDSLEPIELPVRTMLEPRRRCIDYVYFLESGFASVVADGGTYKPIEVGLIGREGMTGLALILGHDRPKNDCYMQSNGRGHRLKASVLLEALDESPSLHKAMLRFAYTFLIQTSTTVLANGRGKIEERLARWLLMAHDRTAGDALDLTQEFLAMMLAVTRPGVTVAVQSLERFGYITRSRGHIVIQDRDGLEKLSNGTYEPPDND